MMWQAPGPDGDQRYGSQDVGNPNASGVHPQFAATPTCWCCAATPNPTRNAFLPACWHVCKTATCLSCGKCATHCKCKARALAHIAPTLTSVMALLVTEPQKAARTRARVTNPRTKARGKGARP